VGRQLHDSLGQQITGIGMIVSSLREQLGSESPHADAAAKLDSSNQVAQRQLRSAGRRFVPGGGGRKNGFVAEFARIQAATA